MHFTISILLLLLAGTALAGEPVLTVTPGELRGLPGEPLRVELTVTSSDARPVRVLVPSVSNLVVRTIENVPIQRTADGLFVQKVIVLWQGTEAGSTTLTNLTAVFPETKITFPALKITVDAVDAASPPVKEPER